MRAAEFAASFCSAATTAAHVYGFNSSTPHPDDRSAPGTPEEGATPRRGAHLDRQPPRHGLAGRHLSCDDQDRRRERDDAVNGRRDGPTPRRRGSGAAVAGRRGASSSLPVVGLALRSIALRIDFGY